MTYGVRAAIARLDRMLVAPGAPSVLAAMRALMAAVIGVRLATRDWSAIADRPAELTYRMWILGWLPGPISEPILWGVAGAGVAGVVLVLARRYTRAAFVLAWVSYLVLTGLWGASGKFMHNDVLTVTVAIPLLFAPSTDTAIDPSARRTRWGWPPRAALAVLGTVYFLTGAQKLRHSGLDWVTSENMSWVLRQRPSPVFGAELTQAIVETPLLPNVLAGGALALELAAPVLLAVRTTRVVFALGATVMHVSIWAFLGLDYSAWIATVWAVVFATGTRVGRWPGWLRPPPQARPRR